MTGSHTYSHLSREERLVLCVGEIVRELVDNSYNNSSSNCKEINLNALKTRLASKYGLDTSPRLVDIISAVPKEHKKTLLPRLR